MIAEPNPSSAIDNIDNILVNTVFNPKYSSPNVFKNIDYTHIHIIHAPQNCGVIINCKNCNASALGIINIFNVLINTIDAIKVFFFNSLGIAINKYPKIRLYTITPIYPKSVYVSSINDDPHPCPSK